MRVPSLSGAGKSHIAFEATPPWHQLFRVALFLGVLRCEDRPVGGENPSVSSSESSTVPMVKPADLGERDHVAHFGWLDRVRHGTVVIQRPLSARVMVVVDVAVEL